MRCGQRSAARRYRAGRPILTTWNWCLTAVFLFWLACIASVCAQAQPQDRSVASSSIAYELSISRERSQRLSVRITAPHPAAPILTFAIPAWTPGYYQILHYERNIDRVVARD